MSQSVKDVLQELTDEGTVSFDKVGPLTPTRAASLRGGPVLTLVEEQPDAHEILVETVKFLRYGEVRGDYEQVVAALNASDPHAAL